MRRFAFVAVVLSALSFFGAFGGEESREQAEARRNDLNLTSYMTAHSVDGLLDDDPDGEKCVAVLRDKGITRVCLEVYRAGLVVEQAKLERVRDILRSNGFEVVGGIATVPGGDFGVRQEGPLGWFNWQNVKTQEDLRGVMRMAAAVFDVFVVDDFLCTGDVSEESSEAKGDRDWSDYRRDLLTRLAQEVFISPAREVNPDIVMVIKFPQWYDRFHMFGYDVEREPKLFDRVWVGTESRGAWTQRFGFVQPYEGFVNYRWLAGISGDKIGAAWFDHGDCDALDFIEQAYQTVLAGAREIVFFNYNDLVQNHGGHDLVRRDFTCLADLAKAVGENPVAGVAAYKPPHSDPGGDLYVMDFVGMLGVPLVPTATFDSEAEVVFLPTQAAGDKDVLAKVGALLEKGKCVVMTAGFVHDAPDSAEAARLAGLEWPFEKTPMRAAEVYVDGQAVAVEYGLDLEAHIEPEGAEVLLTARADGRDVPFMTVCQQDKGVVYVLNTHTYSQADFDAVGEVLLAPRRLGLLELPRPWANTLRNVFTGPLGMRLDAPTRVTMQPLGDVGWVLYNYNLEPTTVALTNDGGFGDGLEDGFTGDRIETQGDAFPLEIPARSVKWLRKAAP